MLAILCPGQGAQQQGFLSPWLTVAGVEENLIRYSDAAGVDLVTAGTVMSDTDITDTAIAQPLIVAASLATVAALPALPRRSVVAGHSVGEFAAAAITGVMAETEAMAAVATRGTAMAAASADQASGMTAVLGGHPGEVRRSIDGAGCVIANVNATGQVVAAGTAAALERLHADPPARARLRRLPVAGAFHTELMGKARDAMTGQLAMLTPRPPRLGLLANADGEIVGSGREYVDRLVAQICSPVRWDLCMATLAALGVTATIEAAPAGTLTGLIRRELPDVVTVALRSPDDLAAAAELVAQHDAEVSDEPLPWRVVVAPAKGTVVLPGQRVDCLSAGDLLARVATRHEQLDVLAPDHGQLIEWLVRDGDPVTAGQPLARVGTAASA